MISQGEKAYNYIPYHHTWDILDSTKSDSYMSCPRSYFFEYVLGWRNTEPNIHLIHGEAHHRAQEIILQSRYDSYAIDVAMDAYEEYYREFFSPEVDDIYYPKVPGVEREVLKKYIELYAKDMDKYEVIATETGGSVAITESDVLWFRMDSIMKSLEHGLFLSMEHKTGSRNSNAWRDKWQTKFQVGTYSHALYCLYPIDEVYGVMINGIFYYKKSVSDRNFVRVPCPRTSASMNLWLNTAQRVLEQIQYDFQILAECSPDDPYLKAFPPYPISCDSWSGCKYLALCSAWPNPLTHVDFIPVGLKVDFWDPKNKALNTKNSIENLFMNKKGE